MPLPIIGLAALGRYITQKGVQQAIKKYGKRAVDKAQQSIAKQTNPSKVKTARGKSGKGTGREAGTIRTDRQGKEYAVMGREPLQATKNVARNKGAAVGAAASGVAAGTVISKKNKEIAKQKEKEKQLKKQLAELRRDKKAIPSGDIGRTVIDSAIDRKLRMLERYK
tara:strand:+ start:63 stop:563 length:501 start_codon:yes stop_codon:yes gene_type:complete